MTGLLGLASALLALAALGATAAGAFAAWKWRFEKGRFLLAVFGLAAALAVGLPRTAALLGLTRGGPDTARLLPDAAVPVLLVALLQTLARQDRAARRAASLAIDNMVTGLPNRRAFLAQMTPALARSRREGRDASVIAVAIDRLGEIEASHGPAAARDALRNLADVIRDTARTSDLPGHPSPTVIAALLPDTSAEAAKALAVRLRAQAALSMADPAMDGGRTSISVGIAPVGEGFGPTALEEALEAAETALARIAAAGGDAVATAPAPPPRDARAAAA